MASAVLITRPQPDAERFAALLADRGHATLIDPMLHIHPLPWTLQRFPDALLITSRHALPALASYAQLRTLPCFVVGEDTAQSARTQGLQIAAAAPTAATLAHRLQTELTPGTRILYARGRHIAFDFVNALTAKQVIVDEAVVYEAIAATQLSSATQKAFATQGIAVVPFFSVRNAEIFCAMAESMDLSDTVAIAISENVAAILQRYTWKKLLVSPAPTAVSMAEIIDKLLQAQ